MKAALVWACYTLTLSHAQVTPHAAPWDRCSIRPQHRFICCKRAEQLKGKKIPLGWHGASLQECELRQAGTKTQHTHTHTSHINACTLLQLKVKASPPRWVTLGSYKWKAISRTETISRPFNLLLWLIIRSFHFGCSNFLNKIFT